KVRQSSRILEASSASRGLSNSTGVLVKPSALTRNCKGDHRCFSHPLAIGNGRQRNAGQRFHSLSSSFSASNNTCCRNGDKNAGYFSSMEHDPFILPNKSV